MTGNRIGRPALAALIAMIGTATLHAQVSVTTYHNDLSRTGANTAETILTPANVNSTLFGKLFSVPVDGAVYAQPLYLYGVSIAGGTHNVLYIVTEHDSVFAIDADSGTLYTQVSLIPAGGSTVNSETDLGCGDLVPEVGITGTPVIDPATGTLYVVAKSKVKGTVVQYLHALDVATLAEKFNGPTLIQAQVPGTGLESSNGLLAFDPLHENQRAALALTNGHVIIGWSSHCDNDPWHGWVMSYSAGALALEAAFNTSPNSSHNGVWMSGAAPAIDASGNIYFATGNGNWNGTTEYGDSVVKLGPPANGSFPVLDYFTPYDQANLEAGDTDLASGGIVLLPPLASGARLLAQQGKAGTIVLLNTSNLGKYCVNLSPPCSGTDTQIVQEIQGASSGIWGTGTYWNGNLYWTGANDTINAYSFNANNSGLISTSPTSQSKQVFAFSAPTPVVSANGTTNGILWALDGSADDSTCDGGGSNCLGLYAYDATNLKTVLYISSQAANNRDSPGTAVKFEKPIVANGKVYVGTQSSVTAFGLLSGALPVAATPTFSPGPGTYTAGQTVSLNDTTPGATIYYTTNGTTPSLASTPYTKPISISATTTLEAIAVASGYSASAVASGNYLLNLPTYVSLTSVANVDAIVANGTPVPGGGLDALGDAYSATLLGQVVYWNGNSYTLGATGSVDAVSNATIALPQGNYTTINVLGTGIGNQKSQSFVVNYTDGSSATITQSLSDWHTPQNYAGEFQVSKMAYRLAANGSEQSKTTYLYGYSFAIDATKTVASLTLPATRDVVVLAIDVSSATPGLTSSSGLHLLDHASESGGTLTLTTSGVGAIGAVWSATPLNIQSFVTDFTFQITPAEANIGDGFTFTIQNAGPSAIGGGGGKLGYAGIGSSVAVKFDLHNNSGEGPDSTGFYTDGAMPTVPALNLTPSGVDLHSGDTMDAHLTYDGTTLTLTLTDTVTGAVFTAGQAINIPATVGGNSAYVGFTAGVGGTTATQKILTWTFSSGLPLVSDGAGFASSSGLNLLGVSLLNNTLELTNAGGGEANAVWTTTPVGVQSFITDFEFQETNASADGFTFAIQNAGASAVGEPGGGLGYAGLGTSVAVKFDLYNNAGEGTDSTGFYTDGAYPSVPALNLTASGINLHSSDILHAHLVYDGTTLTLTLTDTVTGATFTASQALNIPSTVGASTAYVGFTAGTGGETAIQQILNWTYSAY
jgi:hypothetical protein